MSDSAIRANPSYTRDLQEADSAAYLMYHRTLLAWETEKAAAAAKGHSTEIRNRAARGRAKFGAKAK